MLHVVSLSGGTASAVAADRVLRRYGPDVTLLWFADTLWEDEDLYRFLDDLEAYWEQPIIREADGRTPLEVAEGASIIPNQRRAPCSLQLKILLFRRFLDRLSKPVTVHLGFNVMEEHRIPRTVAEYESIEGVTVDTPLRWPPVAFPPHLRETEAWGIKTPRLYDAGFPHNNCGGRCVRQGAAEWLRLKQWAPERFVEVRDWEQAQRAKGGARANYAILRDRTGGSLKPLTLNELEARSADTQQQEMFTTTEDNFSCFCSY